MNPERGIILAASEGRRMRPITDVIPKPLLTVEGKPLIFHSLERLEAWGVKDILITLEPKLGNKIQKNIENKYTGAANINFIYQEKHDGIGFAILRCEESIGDYPFFVCLSDEFQPTLRNLNTSLYEA